MGPNYCQECRMERNIPQLFHTTSEYLPNLTSSFTSLVLRLCFAVVPVR